MLSCEFFKKKKMFDDSNDIFLLEYVAGWKSGMAKWLMEA